MPRSFLSELGVGFFKGAGETFKKEREDTDELMKMQQKAVLQVNAEKEILKAKEEMEARQLKLKRDNAMQLAGFDANDQTARMFNAPAKTGPRVLSEQTPFTPVLDPEAPVEQMSVENAAQIVELYGEDGNPVESQVVEDAPDMPAPVAPPSRGFTIKEAMPKLSEAQRTVAMSYLMDGKFAEAQRYVAKAVGSSDPNKEYKKKQDQLKAEKDFRTPDPIQHASDTYNAGLPEFSPFVASDKVDEEFLKSRDDVTVNSKEAREELKAANDAISVAKQFKILSSGVETGGPVLSLPGVTAVRSKFSATVSALQDMNTKQMLAGAKELRPMSDTDATLLRMAGLSVEKLNEANDFQAAMMIANGKNAVEYQNFYNSMRRRKAHPEDIDAAWQEYVNANPMFMEGSTPENLQVNTERLGWKEYFKAKRDGTLEETMQNTRNSFEMPPGMPGEPNAQKKDAGWSIKLIPSKK